MRKVSVDALKSVYDAHGPKGLLKFVREGLKEKKFSLEDFSIRQLAMVTGAIDPWTEEASLLRVSGQDRMLEASPALYANECHNQWERTKASALARESLTTSIFPVVTAELLQNKIIEAYDQAPGIVNELITVVASRVRNQKMAGFTGIGGSLDVPEGMPYEETGFGEKYVTTSETKKGRILSINEETIMFDQTGEISRRANMLGEYVKQEWERSTLRAIMDADTGSGKYVYRPSGVAEALYNVDGSNYNYIGASNTTSTSFNAASPLVDWTDFDHVRKYRATEVKDDRQDGTQLPIGMINSGLTMLVPESLLGTALSIYNATQVTVEGATTSAHNAHTGGNPVRAMVSKIVSSPYVDEVSAADYYMGQFSRQFIWNELMPLQTFVQGSGSESAFERDVVLRIKARYYGGLSAVDSVFVTKIDGA